MTENRQEGSSSPADRVSPQKRSKLLALFWYGSGTILLGVFLGMAAGLSKTPVIGILIPLLFSILGGAGGLYLAKAELEAPQFILRTQLVGFFTVLLAISVTFGSVYGIALRTGVGFRSFLPSWSGSPSDRGVSLLPDTEDEFMDPALALELGALRLRLRILGFTPSEENRVLQSAKLQLYEGVPQLTLATELRKVAILARNTGDHAIAVLE
jgi:hypothetical protein